ncbi:MAG: hypothetical protein IT371_20280 [Deltaproteobacteria bacterium]|nr:hypothetical protein [Deltaproteobacteria bacterium]
MSRVSSPREASRAGPPRRAPGASPTGLSALLLACGAALFAGCPASLPSRTCTDGTQCKRGSELGLCEATGYCGFIDPACPSGRRYGELSGVLTNQCVESVTDGGSGKFGDTRAGGADLYGFIPGADAAALGDGGAQDGLPPVDRGVRADQSALPCMCTPGERQTGAAQECGDCSEQTPTRQCGQDCQWGAWVPGACNSSCSGPHPTCDSCSREGCNASTNCKRACVKKSGAACAWNNGTTFRCCSAGGQRGWQWCLPSCVWSPCEAHAC